MTKTYVKIDWWYFHSWNKSLVGVFVVNFEIINGNIGRVRCHWIVLLKRNNFYWKHFFLAFIVYSLKIKKMGILVVYHTVVYGTVLESHSSSTVFCLVIATVKFVKWSFLHVVFGIWHSTCKWYLENFIGIANKQHFFMNRDIHPIIRTMFSSVVKLVRLIKICLSETYSRVRVGRFLSDAFPIHCGLKQGD